MMFVLAAVGLTSGGLTLYRRAAGMVQDSRSVAVAIFTGALSGVIVTLYLVRVLLSSAL